MPHPVLDALALQTRRGFLSGAVGTAALASLLRADHVLADEPKPAPAAKAKRIIYLFQSGAPSQLDLFDHKPELAKRFAENLPDSVRKGQRLTGMTATQETFPVAPSKYQFKQHGRSGAWLSELLPHTAKSADELCFIKSLYTEAINHDPAITFLQTGSQISGRPSMGAWVHYGLGSANENLPAFVVLITRGKVDQPLYSRLWGSVFLPSRHQGVQFRSGKDPVLYLSNPEGISPETRRSMLDTLRDLHQHNADRLGEADVDARIEQYEMAYRMQTSVPEAMDLNGEPERTFELYGPDAKKPGTFAANCILARRLAERGVKFIQLYHQGWDHHGGLPKGIKVQCRETDQPAAALLADLKQRGLLEDTLVVWGGEFGRTVYCQGRLTATDYGRDHHGRCFTVWMAGGGVKPGISHGATDDYSYNVVSDPVHVHDLQATILHCLGIDHLRLTYRFQGRDFRLTDVDGEVVRPILA
jgi:hypothetical protein